MSNQMNQPPLTPEMLEGIKQRCERVEKLRDGREFDYEQALSQSQEDVPDLLAHIEAQERRVEEVEKKCNEWREAAESVYASQPRALQLVHELSPLHSQLSAAQEAIRVKDEALRLNHTYFCSYFEKFPCDCGVAEAKQKALSAGSGGGDDKALLQKARWVATEAHLNQFRRDGKTPYITHPETVASMVEDRLKPIALLHDVVEDSPVIIEEIRENFPPYVADAVDALTRREGEDYDTYIKRVCMNPDAVKVKLADMEHNLSCEPSDNSVAKIRRSLPILIQSIPSDGK